MEAYNSCRLCPRACGVDRTRGERGLCGVPATLTLARAMLHHWEEPCISGDKGSGTIFFSGCPLGCIYCQNRPIATAQVGKEVPEGRLEEIFWELHAQGAHNINLVTATQYTPSVIKAIKSAKKQGFPLPFVWNSSGYESVKTLKTLDGLVDIYLTDMRYSTPRPAQAYSNAPDYPRVAWDAIAEMVRQRGSCIFDEHNLLKEGVVVRLLMLPGSEGEARLSLLRLYKEYGDKIYFSLMQQYTPMPSLPPPLDGRVGEGAYARLVSYARRLGVTRAYVQEREAAEDSFIPHFDLTGI